MFKKSWWAIGLVPAFMLFWYVFVGWWSQPDKSFADRAMKAYENSHYSEAYDLFHKAADNGNVNSEYYLGVMYENGYGVPKDFSTAIQWYKKAALHEHILAKQALGRLLR